MLPYTVFHDPVGRSSERILSDDRPTGSWEFSLTIDLLGREARCKRHKLVLSLTVTALLSVYHWGLSTFCSEDFYLPVFIVWSFLYKQCTSSLPLFQRNTNSFRRLKDLLDFTCMIADKSKTDDGVDAETCFARFFWNKVNFTFASFENLSAVTLTSRRSYVETVSGNSALLQSNGIIVFIVYIKTGLLLFYFDSDAHKTTVRDFTKNEAHQQMRDELI